MLVREIKCNKLKTLVGIFAFTVDTPPTIDSVIAFSKYVSSHYSIHLQLFDAKSVAGWEHIFFSTLFAVEAFEKSINISRNLPTEIAVYASTQRQINIAFRKVGINENTHNIVGVLILYNKGLEETKCIVSAKNLILKKLSGTENDNLLTVTDDHIPKLMQLYNITPEEFEIVLVSSPSKCAAICRILQNRMALVRVEL